jgi:D-alanine-D-alanine ligase
MHGERGEDGSLSALLSLSKIANASPEMLASSVCMSKSFTKTVLKGINAPCLPSIIVKDNVCSVSIEDFGYPVIVKPNTGGSSIGISKAKNGEELEYAIINALSFSRTAIIEPALTDFTEINCACFSDKDGNLVVSECEKPIGRDEVLTFKDKYEDGKRQFPADIDKPISQRIKKMTARIYKELELKGVVRIDYFIKDEKVYVNEINTVPGSLAYYLFSDTLKGFTEILSEIIELSVQNNLKYLSRKFDYKSSVLKIEGVKGGKLKNN